MWYSLDGNAGHVHLVSLGSNQECIYKEGDGERGGLTQDSKKDWHCQCRLNTDRKRLPKDSMEIIV